MTPRERQQLQGIAFIILTDFFRCAAVTLLHGIFTFLFAISTAIFLRRGLKTRASWMMFAVTISTYALSSMFWASTFALAADSIESQLIDLLDLDLAAQRETLLTENSVPLSVYMWTSQLPPIISDAVVIWRAWVLFPDRRWVMIPPILMLVGTTACASAYIARFTAGDPSSTIANNIFGSGIILSVCTNVVTTTMIAYKLWGHRMLVVKDLGSNRRGSAVQRVLDIMIESGFSYSAFQTIAVTLNFLPANLGTLLGYAAQVVLSSYVMVSAIYPTLVIVLINSQRSIVDTYGFSTTFDERIGKFNDREARPATAGYTSSSAAGGISDSECTSHMKDRFDAFDGGEVICLREMGRDEPHRQHAAMVHC